MTLLAVMRRKYVTGAPVIDVTASNGVYWHSNPFTGIVPVTGTVNLPVMLQCSNSCGFEIRGPNRKKKLDDFVELWLFFFIVKLY